MWWLPILPVVVAPLAFETFLVTVLDPELRFLQVDRFGACIERALDVCAQELSVVGARADVEHAATMPVRRAVAVRLLLILVIDSIEAALEIILVLAPGNTGHHMDAIAPIASGLDAIRQPRVDAVNDGNVRSKVGHVGVALAGLETSAFEPLLRVLRERRRSVRHQSW